MTELTAKQEAFCHEYLIDLNATQAATRAGYSPKTAKVLGCQLLTHINVKQRVQELMDERGARMEISKDRIVREYARIGFFDIRKLFNADGSFKKINELDDDTAAAIKSLEIVTIPGTAATISKMQFIDKKTALDSLGKHIGMFDAKKLDAPSGDEPQVSEDYMLKPDEKVPDEPIL